MRASVWSDARTLPRLLYHWVTPRDEVITVMRAERGRGTSLWWREQERERERVREWPSKTLLKQEHCCFRPPACCWSASEGECVCVCVCREVREQMLHYSRYKSHVIINASYHKRHLAKLQTSKTRGPLLTNATHFLQNHTSLNQSVRTRPDSSSCSPNPTVRSETAYRSLSCEISFCTEVSDASSHKAGFINSINT